MQGGSKTGPENNRLHVARGGYKQKLAVQLVVSLPDERHAVRMTDDSAAAIDNDQALTCCRRLRKVLLQCTLHAVCTVRTCTHTSSVEKLGLSPPPTDWRRDYVMPRCQPCCIYYNRMPARTTLHIHTFTRAREAAGRGRLRVSKCCTSIFDHAVNPGSAGSHWRSTHYVPMDSLLAP
jgi:hypothetical protein